MVPWVFLLALAGATAPVLLDPTGALSAAESLPPSLTRAEVQLLAGDGAAALATLAELASQAPGRPGPEADVRVLRLEVDAAVLLVDRARAEARLPALAARPGWGTHARVQAARLQQRTWGRWGLHAGLGCFAAALALLSMGGARELLRPGLEPVVFAAAVLLGVALARLASPILAVLLGLFGVACLALIHAASATLRRTEPGPRGRVLVAFLVLLGAGGALLASAGALAAEGLSWLLAG